MGWKQKGNFCDPNWELIFRNKWHWGTLEMSTPPEIAVGTHFHVGHGTKTILLFLPADGEASWLLLPSSIFLLSGGTVQPKNTYSCILKVTVQVWNSQKRISINTYHSYHQRSLPKLVLTNLTIKSDLVNQPSRKKWGVKLVDVIKHLPQKVFFIVILSLGGWPTKSKEAPSPHDVRLTPLDTNPVFQWLGSDTKYPYYHWNGLHASNVLHSFGFSL